MKNKNEILKDFLDIFDEQLYIETNQDVKNALVEKRIASARIHFINNGFREVLLGKRRLYKNVPHFIENEYIKVHENNDDIYNRETYYSFFHHYLLHCKDHTRDNFNYRRMKSINTFDFHPFFVNFSNNLYTKLPFGRFLKISINVPSSISYRNIKVLSEDKNNNLAFGKKVISNIKLNLEKIDKKDTLISVYDKKPYFIVDLEKNYHISIVTFDIVNLDIDLKSDITISISEDNQHWHNIFTNEIKLNYERIVKNAKIIKYKLTNDNYLRDISFITVKEKHFNNSKLKEELLGITRAFSKILNKDKYTFFDSKLESLNIIKDKLKSLYSDLPITLEFTSRKTRPLELYLKSYCDEIILCLPKKLTKQYIDVQLKNNDKFTSFQLEKLSDEDSKQYIDIIDFMCDEYIFWSLRGEKFNELIFLNEKENKFWTKKWYIIEPNTLEIYYEHGSILRLYRQIFLLLNILTERNLDDLRIIIVTLLIESEFTDIFNMIRNYQLDQLPENDIEQLHSDIAFITSKNLFSGKKILTRHGIQKTILDKQPKKFVQTMNLVSEVFKNDLNLDCIPFYGTLLGIIRDNDFIAHDDDVDMIYLGETSSFEDMLKERDKVIQKLKLHGYKILKVNNNGDYNIHLNINGKLIDLFPSFLTNNIEISFFSAGKIKVAKLDYFYPLQTIKFYGIDIKIPFNSDKILEVRYGENWKIPDKNFGFIRRARNEKYYLF